MKKAFTLTELLVTMSVIGVLAGISIPALKHARDSSKNTKCMSNLRQIVEGYHGGGIEGYSEVGHCPKDDNFRSTSYIFVGPPANTRPIRTDAYFNVLCSSKIKLYQDVLPYHGWRNVGYYDGHVEKEKKE